MANDLSISVLLPVFNGGPYLQEAIESVLAQSYRNFELIIIDDGSTDDSWHTIEKVQDPRVRAIRQANEGLPLALNRAIQLAEGAYIARQDADDVSLPERLEKQIEFLETHRKCGIVGTWAEIRSERKDVSKLHQHPTENHILKFELLFDNPFVHSSMMLRKTALDQIGSYSSDRAIRPAEDYELWSRAARRFDIANIPQVLQIYRDTPGSMSKGVVVNPFLESVINISIDNLSWVTGRERSDPAIINLAALSHAAFHRVAGMSTLQDLISLLFEAADRVSDICCVPRHSLQERAATHVPNVRYNYHRFYDAGRGGLTRRVRQWARTLKKAVSPGDDSSGRNRLNEDGASS